MPLRILAGIITVKNAGQSGRVRIEFNPHQKVNTSTDGGMVVDEMTTSGSGGGFTGTPSKHVAIRQLRYTRKLPGFGEPPPEPGFCKIDDAVTYAHGWSTKREEHANS